MTEIEQRPERRRVVTTTLGPRHFRALEALAIRYESTIAEQLRQALLCYLSEQPAGYRGLPTAELKAAREERARTRHIARQRALKRIEGQHPDDG